MTAGKPFPAQGEGGFSYLGVLFLVALLGLGLAGASQSWSIANQRARERELLWVGNQYARALKSYHDHSPGLRQYPKRLEDLLEDRRYPVPLRHLRRLYPDPVTRNDDWGLLKNRDGGIIGVHSRSGQGPWKRTNFPPRWTSFSGLGRYSEWKFIADGATPAGEAPLPGQAAPSAGRGGENSPLSGDGGGLSPLGVAQGRERPPLSSSW
jgi:type II secretory pathway pseudopilin PulG